MKHRPLDDLEIYELMQLAYPEKFERFEADDSEEEAFDYAQELADELNGLDDIADLLGRVVMLAPVMSSPLTGDHQHCLGDVKVQGDRALMMAVVKRDVEQSE